MKQLTINLKERKIGAPPWCGLQYHEGLGFVQVADDIPLAAGKIKASASLGQKLTSYELGFGEPYITKSVSLGVNLYASSIP